MSDNTKTPEKKQIKEVKRNENYVEQVATNITKEIPHPDNEFHTTEMYIHGYKHTELLEKRSFVDMLFLLFLNELPTEAQETLFEKLLCCLINLGPRYPGTRAAMNAGVARTKIEHMLPISLAVSSGEYLGSADVFNSMKFLRENINSDPIELATEILGKSEFDGQKHPLVVSGFGSFFGGADTYTKILLDSIKPFNPDGKFLNFAQQMVDYWQAQNAQIGFLITGLTAAVLNDLGFMPRHGNVIFQMAIAPGLTAHGVEKAAQRPTAMPFTKEENFHISDAETLATFQPKPKSEGEEL